METSINSRLKEIIDTLYKGNKRAFSSAIGVSPTVIENVVGSRQGKPSYDVIEKIFAKANISPTWLLLGEGPMLRSDQNNMTELLPPEQSRPPASDDRDAYIELLRRTVDEQAAEKKELIAQNRELTRAITELAGTGKTQSPQSVYSGKVTPQ
jgi:transcriptional regulator with XRE-family HTH domain